MKYDLIKFLHWLSVSTFKSKWFEENVKIQTISLLSWFLYPEFRKQNSIISILKGNKIVITFLTTFMIWSVTFFTFGRLTSDSDNTVIRSYILKNELVDTTFTKLVFDRNMRHFIEYTAKEKYKIKYFDNLTKLPDEVFFTLISEIESKKIPYSLFFRLIDQESHFLDVVNPKTLAKSYGQMIPSTERAFKRKLGGYGDRRISHIVYCSHHLKNSFDKYTKLGYGERESWQKSLLDYNGGSIPLAEKNLEIFIKEIDLIKKGE